MATTQEIRKLLAVAPHFMDDKDEDWMTPLPLEKKTFIVDKRAEILAISEQIENHTLVYRNHLTSLRDAHPEKKAQAKKEYEDKKKCFENKRDEKIRDLLPTLRRLKTMGQELKIRMAREEAATFNKRRRLLDALDPSLGSDPSVELVTDDYLPSYLPQQASRNAQQNKKRQKSSTNTVEQVIISHALKSSPKKNRDTFFDGVDDPLDRKVLSDLRSEIIKHNCRDRVIKAIQSITLRDQRLATMESISQLNQLIKNSAN